ncbi:helix-turn-helix domain-containing protein [Novosphingobium soli]|uniref:Helix-turn-helix domain-containing protein n=1 Tax=Novosphingobium soli TaxID=574956 RepID=A0ABV6CXM0_9SPHN
MSESQRYHVRALDRSLAILRALNQHNGLQATELSRLVALPRPTVLRLLNTLSDAGYVARSESDGRYRATRRLRDLSCGYEEETWLRSVVRPFLAELEADLIWPLAVIRLHEMTLIVEALTDHGSQMLERRDSAGTEVAPLVSTAGYLLMALLPATQGDRFLEHALETDRATMARLGWTEGDVREKVAETRRDGFAHLHLQTHSAIAVPVSCEGRISCALNMRMHGTLDARKQIMGRYVGDLHRAAAILAERITQAGAAVYEAPPRRAFS